MNKNITIFLILLLLCICPVFVCGCFKKEVIVSGYHCINFRDDIYGNGKIYKNKDLFQSIPIEKQYALYICSVQYFHPINLGIQELFAERGGEIVEFLKNKLLSSLDDRIIRDIIYLLLLMDQRGHYNVGCDYCLMSIVTNKASSIVDQDQKKIVEKFIVNIGMCSVRSIQKE